MKIQAALLDSYSPKSRVDHLWFGDRSCLKQDASKIEVQKKFFLSLLLDKSIILPTVEKDDFALPGSGFLSFTVHRDPSLPVVFTSALKAYKMQMLSVSFSLSSTPISFPISI